MASWTLSQCRVPPQRAGVTALGKGFKVRIFRNVNEKV